MTERAIENTRHQLAAFCPGIFYTDVKVTETDTLVVGFDLYSTGSDTVIIFEFQPSAADAETVETFVFMFVLVTDFQGGIFLTVLELSLDISGYFELLSLRTILSRVVVSCEVNRYEHSAFLFPELPVPSSQLEAAPTGQAQ